MLLHNLLYLILPQFFIDSCETIPCENGGTCKDGKCICKPGCTGKYCKNCNPCKPNPCQNGGKCIKGTGPLEFTCTCKPGCSGKYCEKCETCNPNPCKNGGTCKTKNDGSIVCHCKPGCTGKRCGNCSGE